MSWDPKYARQTLYLPVSKRFIVSREGVNYIPTSEPYVVKPKQCDGCGAASFKGDVCSYCGRDRG